MLISSHNFAHVEELYNHSLYVQAYTAAQKIAPLEAWEGTAARILAGRLAATVGAPKLGRRHQLLAYRHDPKDWEARYYYARIILSSRGALAAWQFLRHHDNDLSLADANPKVRSDWLALHAFVLARLRDFKAADPWLMRAEQVAPDNVWVWVERAKVFELQDRHDDTLAVLRYALILQPWFRPTIQTSARALVLQGREEEAARLLMQASQHIECAWVVEQLAHLQIDLGQYAEAGESLDRFVELSPHLEPEVLKQLEAERANIAYLQGDYSTALAFARQSASPALQKFAAQLQKGAGKEQRVVLPVGFVRQHHMTCAPATLAAISQYYKMPAEHLRVAEEICHDGTAAHSIRKWAQQNGYAAREFRVTWENAVELLQRNIVFTLGTVDPGAAHLQAVIGYDSVRRTLIIRDASQRHYSEWDAKTLLERYRACGPHGMALVPAQYAQSLNSLPLAEAELYDHLFAVRDALENHDRARAQGRYQAMPQGFGEHRLTLQARLDLAIYDDDHAQMLGCYEKLLALFPEDATLQLSKALCLRVLMPREQRLAYLREICTREKADSLLWQEYAKELCEDARQWPEAMRCLNKALRRDLMEARGVHLLAAIRWQQQRREEAMELYRIAACLDDNDEQFAQSYFLAAHQLERTDAALEFLRTRLQGKKSGQGMQTLFQSLARIGRIEEAFAVVETGLEKFHNDGKLKLFAAEVYARHGLFDQATSLLQQAKAQAPNREWLRTTASIAALRGQWDEALSHWQQIADAEPYSLEANQQVAQLLARIESPRAAIEFLRDRIARDPQNTRLRALLIERLRDDPALAEPELRYLLKHDTTDDWAQRTLAAVLFELHRHEEALVASEAACRIAPTSAENHFIRGQMLAQVERYAESREAFRTAITLSADFTPAPVQFITTATTPQEQREALQSFREEIMRQVTPGESLLAYQALAKDILPADELLHQLRDALQQRPDLPTAYTAVIAQLVGMHQLDEAHSVARRAIERFSLFARSWFDLALTHELRGEDEQQIHALRRALSLDPSFALATQKLVEVYEQLGQLPEARSVIGQAIAHSPFNHYHHGQLADLCWKLDEKENALATIQRVLSLAPDYDWAWRALKTWAEQTQQPTLPLQCAHALTEQRPGDARAWLVLARTLKGDGVLSEQLAALDHAVQLNPRLLEAHTLRAFLLADAGRYDEALRACRPATLAPMFPPELLSAEAYVIAQCGDLPGALEKMRNVLKAEPNFAPGWERIARWYRTLQMEKEYLEAAHNLARVMPQYSVAHGYLGEAKLWNGDREGAKESLQRAVTLTPDYDFAGLTLFDLQLEDNDLRAAEKTLAKLRQFVGGNATNLRALKLAVCTDDPGQVQRNLFALCQSPVHISTYLDQAVEAITPTRLDKIIDVVFEDVLARPDINPHIGTLWARRCTTQNKTEHCLKRLHKMAAQATGKLWHNAAAAFLDVCAHHGAAEHVHNFIRQYDGLLRTDTESWGAVGAALYNLGEAQAAADWLGDWQERDGVTPHTLWHLALALRDLNREGEAKEVGTHAINLPEDQRTSSHLALLSLDEALAGQIETATQHAARIAPQALNEWDQVMIELATSLREFHTAHNEGRSSGQAVIDKLLQLAEHSPGLKKSNTLVHLFKRAIENVLATENDSMLRIKTKLKMKWFEYRAH